MLEPDPSPAKPDLSRDDYALLVESIEDYAILILDPAGHIATWNPGAERIKGWSAAEITGKHFSVFYLPEDVAAGKPDLELKTVSEQGRLEDEGWRVRKDGTRFWANIVITALRDEQGNLKGYGKVTRDLSARRQTEEALRRSEERLRLMIEAVGDYAIYMLDPTGVVTTWNAGAESIKGYASQEIVGQHFSLFFTPEAVAAGDPQRELAVAAASGRSEEEGWRLRKDGSRFWASVIVTAIRDARGRLLGFAKITRDLTARQAAQEAERELVRVQAARTAAEQAELTLREERERYRTLSRRLEVILEGVGDGITVQDRSGGVLFANSAAAQTCGFATVGELLAAQPAEIRARFEILDEAGMPIAPATLPGRRALATGEPASAVLRVRELGSGRQSWRLVRATAVMGADDKPDLAVNIWHDVTEERRREEHERYLARATATLSSSLDYESMLSALAALLVPGLADWCSVDLLDGAVLKNVVVAHADPAKVALARELQRKYPADPDQPRGVWNVLRTGESERYEEISDALLEQGARDAEHLAVLRGIGMKSALIVPIRIRDRVSGAISLVSAEGSRLYDRSDLALAEELGRRAGACIENAKLYADAQSAAVRAQDAALRAEEASRLKDEFLATVSHELRTPLNAIVGWSTLLRDRPADVSLAKGIDVIHRNAQAQAKIIEDILDVSRIVTGNLRLEVKPADLAATVRGAIEVICPSAAAKRITIDFAPPDEPCLLVADPERLQQVVWNLLSNAVKFTNAGGSVTVTIVRESSKLSLSIADTGNGIDSDFLPYVFERFKQADGSTTRRVGGLGLGLSIVRHIVELHGGQVRAESAGPGAGSTFTITLPIRAVAPPLLRVAERASEGDERRESRPAPSLRDYVILVVDDEPDARDLIHTVLTAAGATVETAASAAEALQLLERLEPHVLVSDVGMPDEDGYSFMRRVRSLDRARVAGVPAIALTAYTRDEDRTKALAVGFTTHIGKPVNPDDLLAAVTNLALLSRR